MRKQKEKYIGFSFIELLLTLMILMVIMLLVASTLTTISRVSVTTSNKNLARNDVNYIMDSFRRAVSNADIQNIQVYDSSESRVINQDGQMVILESPIHGNQYQYQTGVDKIANEIQVKLYGYDYWMCLGYFRDAQNDVYGYIVKTVNRDDDLSSDPSLCFDNTAILTFLHSYSVNIKDFKIIPVDMGDDLNKTFLINATVEPLLWPVSDTFPVTKDISRQAVVSTGALTVY
jgi:type II secretory pathway pseudopilin PulG